VTRTSGNCSRNGRHQPYHHPRHSQLVTSHVHGPIIPLASRHPFAQAPRCPHTPRSHTGGVHWPDLYSPGTTLGRSALSRPAAFRRRKERTRREERSRLFAVTRRLRGSCRRGSARSDTSGANPQCSHPRPGPGASDNRTYFSPADLQSRLHHTLTIHPSSPFLTILFI
jgi:hypothetical protein